MHFHEKFDEQSRIFMIFRRPSLGTLFPKRIDFLLFCFACFGRQALPSWPTEIRATRVRAKKNGGEIGWGDPQDALSDHFLLSEEQSNQPAKDFHDIAVRSRPMHLLKLHTQYAANSNFGTMNSATI